MEWVKCKNMVFDLPYPNLPVLSRAPTAKTGEGTLLSFYSFSFVISNSVRNLSSIVCYSTFQSKPFLL